jgi:hypothetical protein
MSKLPVLLLAVAGCGIVGNGKVTSVSYEVPAFRKLSIGSAFAARATAGTRAVTVNIIGNPQSTIISTGASRVNLTPLP